MHRLIALRCFELMKPALRRNILDPHETSILNEDILDLSDEVRSRINPEAAYACRFWLGHFHESRVDESILENCMNSFPSGSCGGVKH